MDNIERRDKEMSYIADAGIQEELARTRVLLQRYNAVDRGDVATLIALARELLGCDHDVWLNPPFWCDYGSHIKVGRNFFANYNCTIVDVAQVTFGDNCLLGPNVAIYTAGHPVHPDTRNSGYEYGIGVSVGDNVWIGGSVVICPGVHIGSNSVIGAGSVVTRDIPEWSVAAGNPCRVIRPITEEDRRCDFRRRLIDDEAWQRICGNKADEH